MTPGERQTQVHSDPLHEFTIHEYPISEELGRELAIADNDRDVAAGHPVSLWELDLLEAIDRDLQRQLAHIALFGAAEVGV